MDTVQFKYVADLIVKPLGTLEELRKALYRFENLCILYEETCDDPEKQRRFKLLLNEATELKNVAEQLLDGCHIRRTNQSNNEFISGPRFAKQSIKTENAIKFNSWNKKTEQVLIELNESIGFLEHYARDTEMLESKLLARRTKDKSSLVEPSTTNLQIYKLPTCLSYEEPKAKIRRISVGSRDLDSLFKPTKVIMMTGITGSGKTLMINAFVNYLYGVCFEDSFRFELVDKSKEKQERDLGSDSEAMSMTSWVTGYELKWQRGFRFDENILLIDTPGFADPRGLLRDREIIESIKQFFEDDKACTVDGIASVAFIMKASSGRLTKEEKHSIDQVLHLFGVDLKRNLIILFTFAAYEEDPPALACVKADQIPYIEYHCIDNRSSLFKNRTPRNRPFWEQNEKAFNLFFETLKNIPVTNLQLTKEVLRNRASLNVILEDIKWKIKDSMLTLKDIEACVDALLALTSIARGKEEFQCANLTYRAHRKLLENVANYCMNCNICEQTCHFGCKCLWKYWCSCFDYFSKCKVCDIKCGKNDHVKERRMYKRVETLVSHRVESLLREHSIPPDDPEAERRLLEKLDETYRLQKEILFYKIWKATDIMHRLDVIALRNSMCSQVDYITHLIETEKNFGGTSDGTDKIALVQMLERMREIMQLAYVMQLTMQGYGLSSNQSSSSRSSEVFDDPNVDGNSHDSQNVIAVLDIWLNMTEGCGEKIENKLKSIRAEKAQGDPVRGSIINRAKRAISVSIKSETVGAYRVLERKVESSLPDQSTL